MPRPRWSAAEWSHPGGIGLADYVLFGGTTEGRVIAEAMEELGISCLVCVATEYGEKLLHPGEFVQVHTGRLNMAAMCNLLGEEKPKAVLDATHPYAVEVSRNIRTAAENLGISYVRVLRESESVEDVHTFQEMEDLIDWLNTRNDVIFSSMGAKEAKALTAVQDFENRVWVRILPLMDSLKICLEAGIPAKHIICMQGPFSTEINTAMFHAAGAGILVTKESGRAGGFAEKLQAAKECGMETAVLCRPETENGLTVEQLLCRIKEGTL